VPSEHDLFVLTNAQLIRGDGLSDDGASAVAVRHGRIAAVGGSELTGVFPGARVVDLGGRSLLPGINDSHTHLGIFGSARPPLALDLTFPNVGSIEQVAELVRARVSDPPADGWIRGFGWDLGYLTECRDGRRMPTRLDLDTVAPHTPVVLQDFSCHMIWANTEALRRAGVTATTPVPEGGVILRDHDGEPTGILQEGAQHLVQTHMPAFTREAKRTALRTSLDLLHANGVTSVTDAALGPGGAGLFGGAIDAETLELLAELVGADGVRMRTNVLLLFAPLGSVSLAAVQDGLTTYTPPPEKRDWFRIAGVKLFADGIPPNQTAWMHQCYSSGGHGALTIAGGDVDEQITHLQRLVQTVHDAGYQLGVHVTGDRAIEAVTQAFIAAQHANPRPDPRHYLIHGDFTSPEVMDQCRRYGIGINMQPAIQWTIAELTEQLLGRDHAEREWPMSSALRAGVVVASSSDCPITYPNWLQGAAAAVLRESKANGSVYGPDERVTVEQAVQTYTRNGAWQDHAETWKGTISPGQVADLCVVDARLLDDDPHDWAAAKVSATVVGGETVYGEL
jgi:predicted amidohydrolase YtcJ